MQGKIALVTGGGSGIGKAVALRLGKAGYTLVVAGRRLAPLEEVAHAIGNGARPVAVDVRDAASVDALFAQVKISFGRLDVLFNNAGMTGVAGPLEDLELDQWRAVVDTNLTGMFLCLRGAFRLMKTQDPRGGRIINNGSISAQVPRPNMIAYTATKHAVSGLTKSASLEGRKYNIACGQIDIGNTQTDMAANFTQGTLQADFSLRPEPLFDVAHVADAVLYIANLPLDANVLSMNVMATAMPYVGRG